MSDVEGVVPDGKGGWYSGWSEDRSSGSIQAFAASVFVQHYDSTGAVSTGWPQYGLRLGDSYSYASYPLLTTDGAGGVFAAWEDAGVSGRIRGQHVSSEGTLNWAQGGTDLSSVSGAGRLVSVLYQAGAFYVAWIGVQHDVVVQRVDNSGSVSPGWSPSGLSLGDASSQWLATLLPSGNGVMVIWAATVGASDTLRAQRLDDSGSILGPPGGFVLERIANPFLGGSLRPFVASDSAGGVIVLNEHYGDGGAFDIFTQRFDVNGAPRWAASELLLSTSSGDHGRAAVAADGFGGAYFVWTDQDPGFHWVAQHLDSAGAIVNGWPADGSPVMPAGPGASSLQIRPDPLGGSFCFGNNEGTLVAQHLDESGVISESWTTDGILLSGSTAVPSLGASYAALAEGAVIASWVDVSGSPISLARRAQRVTSTGNLAFDTEGLVLSSDEGAQRVPAIIPDGFGGAVLAWQQTRSGQWDILSRSLDGSGNPQGATVSVCSAATDQLGVDLAATGGDGYAAVWADFRSNPPAVYAQRVVPVSGTVWTQDGLLVATGINNFIGEYHVAGNGSGGELFLTSRMMQAQSWDPAGTRGWTSLVSEDGNDQLTYAAHLVSLDAGASIQVWTRAIFAFYGGLARVEVRAQRLGATGQPEWGDSAITVRTFPALPDTGPSLRDFEVCEDGSGGAFVATNEQLKSGTFRLRLLHVQADGTLDTGWPTLGLILSAPATSLTLGPICYDGIGGAIVGWTDGRNGADWKSFVQRISSTGTELWQSGGVPVSGTGGSQWISALVHSGAGGATAAWRDERGDSWDVYAQQFDAAGAAQWGSAGLAICSAPGTQEAIRAVSDGFDGVFVAWQDERDPAHDVIMATRVSAAGALL